MNDREFLHHLVERLSAERLDEARLALGQLTDDPLLRSLATAPLDDEPLDPASIGRHARGPKGQYYSDGQVEEMLKHAANRLVG